MALDWPVYTLFAFLLLFPIFWQSSHLVRYYVKLFFYYSWILLSASCLIPIAIFQPRNVANIGYIQSWWRRIFSVFGPKCEVRGAENLVYDKPSVIVCNHQSELDLIAMMQVMPPRTTALAKKELIYAGPFGLSSWLAGIVFVDRENREKAHDTMQQVSKIMHERQIKIWIFPEGTRNLDGHLLPFKKGAFNLAVQAKVPIFPVVISSFKDFLCNKRKIFNPGKFIITCLPMISTEGLTLDDVVDLTERTYKVMTNTYEAISREVHEEAVREGGSILANSDS